MHIPDIRFYDFEFNPLHIENQFLSSNWSLYYNAIGQFEAHFDLSSDTVPVVMENKYLVAVQGQNAAIITGKIVGNDLAVFGRTPNWLLTRRTTPEFKRNDTVEAMARDIVRESFSDVPNIVVEDTVLYDKTMPFWRNTIHPTDEVIKDCLDNDNAGHEIVFDIINKQWVFRVLKGIYLPVIVSEDNRNTYDTEYSEDCLGYFTSGYYDRSLEDKGDWDASTNTPQLVNNIPSNYGIYYRVSKAGTQFGITFEEGDYIIGKTPAGAFEKATETEPLRTYISGEKTGIYKWDCTLSGENESEANTSLTSKKWNRAIKSKCIDLKCGRDYNLGDTLRVQIQKGAFKTTEIKRIIGVNIWMEYNDCGEQPIFEEDL